MNAKVQEFMSRGMSRRQAYRLAKKDNNGEKLSKETAFDYESECPKGEWV